MKVLSWMFGLGGIAAIATGLFYDAPAGSLVGAFTGSALYTVGGTFVFISIVFHLVARMLPGNLKRLRTTGVHGIGTVTGVRPTSMSDGDQGRYVDLDLQVTLDTGGAAFPTTGRLLVPVWEIAALAGRQMHVFVDEADRSKVFIDGVVSDAPAPAAPAPLASPISPG